MLFHCEEGVRNAEYKNINEDAKTRRCVDAFWWCILRSYLQTPLQLFPMPLGAICAPAVLKLRIGAGWARVFRSETNDRNGHNGYNSCFSCFPMLKNKKMQFFRPEMKKSGKIFAYVKDTLYLCIVKRPTPRPFGLLTRLSSTASTRVNLSCILRALGSQLWKWHLVISFVATSRQGGGRPPGDGKVASQNEKHSL